MSVKEVSKMEKKALFYSLYVVFTIKIENHLYIDVHFYNKVGGEKWKAILIN